MKNIGHNSSSIHIEQNNGKTDIRMEKDDKVKNIRSDARSSWIKIEIKNEK